VSEIEEIVDGLPVLHEEAPAAVDVREHLAPGEVVVSQRRLAALTATGFAAGAATVALTHRRQAAKLLKRGRRQKRLPFGDVLASNSFLVDVHLLRRD
jgi:hypothetical protein